MADKNTITLIGHVGSNIKRGKTQNGDSFIGFLMRIESRSTANSSENNYSQMISIRCFKPNVIKYLDKVGLTLNTPIIVFGFVSSYQDEVKGKSIWANSINGNEIYVIKTRPYND